MAVSKKKEKLNYSEFGTSGYSFSGGKSRDEYQTDLSGGKAFSVYEKMYKSSGLTRAIYNCLVLPYLASEWYFEAAQDGEKQSEEIRDKVSKNFFKTLNVPWNTQLSQIIKYLVFGCKPFEIVPQDPLEKPALPDEFPQRIRKIAPRHPSTIYKWKLDANGGLEGITQRAYFNMGENSVIKNIFLPIENLVIYINGLDGDNYEGESIYRPCYRHYYALDKFYNISNIGVERQACGIPIIEFDGEVWAKLGDTEKDKYLEVADQILKNYRVHKYAGFKLLPGMKLTISEGKFNSQMVMGLINHHDTKMAQSLLMSFLTTGEGKVGSYALSANQTNFYLLALDAYGKDMCDTTNRHVVKKVVGWNYDNIQEYPSLKFILPKFDVDKYLQALNLAIGGKIVTPTRSLELYTRNLLGLPQLEDDEEAISERVEQVDQAVKQSLREKSDCSHYHFSEELPWRRELTKAEKRVDFADMKKTFSSMEEELQKKLEDITARQLTEIQKQIQAREKIEVPLMDKVQALYEDFILKGGKYGQGQVEKEFNTEIKNIENIEQYAKQKAEALADKHRADLLVFVTELLDMGGERDEGGTVAGEV